MGRMRAGRGVLAALLGMACAMVPAVVATTSAAAGGVILKVSPNTGLHSGDTVDVAAYNLPANTLVGAVECTPGADSIFACLGAAAFGISDGNGSFDAPLVVTRYPGVDCGQGGCFIGLAVAPGDAFVATQAITFDASVPATTFVVTPSTNLPFVAHVHLSGKHWTPNAFVEVQQCTADQMMCTFPPFDIAPTDAQGKLVGEVFVRRQFSDGFPGDPETDCTTYPGGCVLLAAAPDGSGAFDFLAAPIVFDPSSPIPPPPVLRVEPHTRLADHQIVEISGSRFTPHSPAAVGTCVSAAGFIGCAFGSTTPIDAQGRLAPVFMGVRRVVGTIGGVAPGRQRSLVQQRRLALAAHFGPPAVRAALSGTEPIDCAKPAFRCSIDVQSDADGVISQLLTFDPNAPPAPAPVVTVTPTTRLKDRELVHVSGHGFVPGSPALAIECLRGGTLFVEGSGCDEFVTLIGLADAHGRIDADIAVHRRLTFLDHTDDCVETACFLRVYGEDDRIAPVALHFDPGAPPAPPPTLSVTPNTGLHDNDRVTVNGAKFPASSGVIFGECATDGQANPTLADIVGCLPTIQNATTDGHGAFASSFTVASHIALLDGSVVDCTASPDCVILAESTADPTALALAPVSFAAG